MGIRGKLPAIKVIGAAELDDLTPPDWLSDLAKEHWASKAAFCAANNLLTTATADSFALMCDLWGKIRAMQDYEVTRTYLDTMKAYGSLAKMFRLVPCDKPGEKIVKRDFGKTAFNM